MLEMTRFLSRYLDQRKKQLIFFFILLLFWLSQQKNSMLISLEIIHRFNLDLSRSSFERK